jgi:hypothetical protein
LIRYRDRQVWAELEEFLTENVYETTESDDSGRLNTNSGGDEKGLGQDLPAIRVRTWVFGHLMTRRALSWD